MKRNTALKCLAWAGTFGVTYSTAIGPKLYYEALAGLARYKYDIPVPANSVVLDQLIQIQPDARPETLSICIGVLAVVSIFFGAILVALFGEPKADKPVAK